MDASTKDPRPVVEVRDVAPDELEALIGVVARGMRDNPFNIAVFGNDPERRQRRMTKTFRTWFDVFTEQVPLVAIDDSGSIVGGTGVAPPGSCQATVGQQLRSLPSGASLGPRVIVRAGRALRGWGKRDIAEPHWHLGPFAVDAHLQGRGIGTQVLLEHTRRLDDIGAVGYLETDKDVNVRLYERHGYQVIDEGPVLSVHCWFMRRPASSGTEQPR